MPVTVTCFYCEKVFTTSPSRTRQYCSNTCYRAHREEQHRTQQTCVICGKQYEASISRAKEQATCRSQECSYAFLTIPEYKPNYGQRKYTFTCLNCKKTGQTSRANRQFCTMKCKSDYHRIEKTCVICGKKFTQGKQRSDEQVTCRSQECVKAIKFGAHNPFYGKHHTAETKEIVSKKKTHPRIEVQCTCGCGEIVQVTFARMRRNKTDVFFTNADHLHTWLQGKNHWNYRGGRIYYGDEWNKVARAVRERDKACQECGKTPEENGRALDVHHKVPARVSRDNSPENLVALCISCHQKHQVLEQYDYPLKVNKYRKCPICDTVFIPEPFQKVCSDECRRKRTRQWEKKYIDTHPEAYKVRRQRITNWQKTNKERVNASHQRSRLRKKQTQQQEHSA